MSLLIESKEVVESQRALYPSARNDDDLSQKIVDAREVGETSLFCYLYRNSIYG